MQYFDDYQRQMAEDSYMMKRWKRHNARSTTLTEGRLPPRDRGAVTAMGAVIGTLQPARTPSPQNPIHGSGDHCGVGHQCQEGGSKLCSEFALWRSSGVLSIAES